MRSDVCLILEGTYPYVAGGVSTWVAQILEAMPQIHFSILYIGPSRDAPRKLKYKIPPNVVEIKEAFIHDYPDTEFEKQGDCGLSESEWRIIGEMQDSLFEGRICDLEPVLPILEKIDSDHEMVRVFGYSNGAWELATRQYEKCEKHGISFIDYFWTQRFVYLPLMHLLRTPIPKARVYHTACTGYAGFLGVKAAIKNSRPLLVTEHGLYTRERRLEIFNADWIREMTTTSLSLEAMKKRDFFKEWWTSLFMSLSLTTYSKASALYTLFEANRVSQVADGADPNRLHIIPNGIDLKRYGTPENTPPRDPSEPFRIGFVGRVTAIKDVKTLLRAFRILKTRKLNFEAFIMGPMDEEEDYARECLDMADSLELSDCVSFTGRVNVMDYYPDLDVIVLTSVSEGLPFVILEAHCAQLPVVATDVGACRELLYGREPDDQDLGQSGYVTHIASPSDTADELEKLARDPVLAQKMGKAGLERVRRYYDIRDVMEEYRSNYERFFYFDV